MKVLLCYSPKAREVIEEPLRVPSGCTAGQALALSQTLLKHPQMHPGNGLTAVGLRGRKCQPQQVLQEGDRLELYRPLKVDPKVARRERYQKQGPGVAGRFAKLRPGAKQGY
jgi:uncharacterized protein